MQCHSQQQLPGGWSRHCRLPGRVSAFSQGRGPVPAVRECRTHSGLQLGSNKGLRADVRAAAFVEGAGGQAEATDCDEGAHADPALAAQLQIQASQHCRLAR